MLVDRHEMSRTVREEVTPKSNEWGYQLGSIYIRKVHFRDPEMIRQIESKVVNRLRQVTAAIKQDGVNQVSIITSTAERQAAVEFGKAAAVRPAIVGKTMADISRDAEVAEAMFELLETQRIVEGKASLTLVRHAAARFARRPSGSGTGCAEGDSSAWGVVYSSGGRSSPSSSAATAATAGAVLPLAAAWMAASFSRSSSTNSGCSLR